MPCQAGWRRQSHRDLFLLLAQGVHPVLPPNSDEWAALAGTLNSRGEARRVGFSADHRSRRPLSPSRRFSRADLVSPSFRLFLLERLHFGRPSDAAAAGRPPRRLPRAPAPAARSTAPRAPAPAAQDLPPSRAMPPPPARAARPKNGPPWRPRPSPSPRSIETTNAGETDVSAAEEAMRALRRSSPTPTPPLRSSCRHGVRARRRAASVPRRPRPRWRRGERPGPRVRRLLRALRHERPRAHGPAVLGRARNLPDVRRRAPQGRRHNPMPEVSRGRDGRRQSEPRPHRRATAAGRNFPFPTSLYMPGTSLVQFELARQDRVHPRDLPHGGKKCTVNNLDAEALEPLGEEALAPRPSRRLLLLLGQRQESARAQVFDGPDALRASVKVALVEDVH